VLLAAAPQLLVDGLNRLAQQKNLYKYATIIARCPCRLWHLSGWVFRGRGAVRTRNSLCIPVRVGFSDAWMVFSFLLRIAVPRYCVI
jgi:hypothetical protein